MSGNERLSAVFERQENNILTMKCVCCSYSIFNEIIVMWLLSQAHKNTEYLRNIFYPEAFVFMEEEMLTVHRTPCTLCNSNTTFFEFLCHHDKSL